MMTENNTTDSYIDDIERNSSESDAEYAVKKSPVRRVLSELVSWIPVILVAMAIATVLNAYVILNATVPTGSMMDTIMKKDRMVGNRLAYLNSDPKRGDIIIFKAPDKPEELYVKRVIGLPGETVKITDGKIYINDSETPLNEDYIYDEHGNPWTDTWPVYNVPEDSYFVLGDNRNNSHDARYWNNTYVKRDAILAEAMCVYWPISDMKMLGGYEYQNTNDNEK